jgi:hypothetical protein
MSVNSTCDSPKFQFDNLVCVFTTAVFFWNIPHMCSEELLFFIKGLAVTCQCVVLLHQQPFLFFHLHITYVTMFLLQVVQFLIMV